MYQYYLEHVTGFGEKHEIYASEDIKNASGVNLITKGTRINELFLDRLLKHKLLRPIDDCLKISDVLNGSKLKICTITAFEEATELHFIFNNVADFNYLSEYMNNMLLNNTLLNKLSIMKYCLPKHFEHSLLVAIICLFIGKICLVSESEMQQLAMIGLFHDLGVLHIDPLILNEDRELNASEWRQMYAHPLIGFLIIQKQIGLPPIIARAVMEHHERLDGSGYPRHITDSKITKLSRIIALAEMIQGICRKNSGEHLTTILKSNIEKVDKNIVENICHSLYNSHNNYYDFNKKISNNMAKDEIFVTLQIAETVTDIFCKWQILYLNNELSDSIFLKSRIDNILHCLNQAGIAPLNIANTIMQLEQDISAIRETKYLLIEALYQLKNIVRAEQQRHTDENHLSPALQDWIYFSGQQLTNNEKNLKDLL